MIFYTLSYVFGIFIVFQYIKIRLKTYRYINIAKKRKSVKQNIEIRKKGLFSAYIILSTIFRQKK